jgi:opacity protein-like surface antigen
MSIRTSTLSLAIAAVTMAASAAFAADVAQPETPGSQAPKAVAEAAHLSRVHGIDSRARQPQAQAAGDAKAQAVSEAIHLKKSHGVINDSADKQLEFAHPNH